MAAPSAMRSLLIVPGNRPERIAKAHGYGADAVTLDLEDSVPPAEHADARRHVAAHLDAGPPSPVFVRSVAVDRPDFAGDLEAVVRPGLSAITLPHIEHPDAVREADALVGRLELERGMPRGGVRLLPSAESARAVRRLYEILTASPRVLGTNFNGAEGGDLCRDLGAMPSVDGDELLYVRSKVLFEARAAGLDHIIDGVFTDLDDEAGLERSTVAGRRLGYTGRAAIHPRQLAVINHVHSPSAAELEAARSLIAAFRAGEREGRGAIRHRGKLVDYAMVRHAEQLLERRLS